jgi:hypothetical protein
VRHGTLWRVLLKQNAKPTDADIDAAMSVQNLNSGEPR